MVFRGLKFLSDAEIGEKDSFRSGANYEQPDPFIIVLIAPSHVLPGFVPYCDSEFPFPRHEDDIMTEISLYREIGKWVEDRSPFGLLTTDLRFVVTEWNGWLESRSGWGREDVVGKRLLGLYPDLITRNKDRYFEEALRGRTSMLSQSLHGYLLPMKGAGGKPDTVMPQSAFIFPLVLDHGVAGTIVYIQDVSERVQREKELTDLFIASKRAQAALEDREEALRRKSKRFEELNTALNVMLKKREEDKLAIEEKVLFNVRELIEPLINSLQETGLDENQTGYVDVLRNFLEDIVSPFSQTLHAKFLGLTLSEIRVANLIKEGRSTKQIASLLNSTPRAITFHRQNIRKKLGLSDRSENLGAHLLSLSK